MRALVTGGRGFIGSHVVDALVADGHEVRVYDAAPLEGARADVDHVIGDICDEDLLARSMADRDAVFHLAAVYSYARADAEAMQRVNVEGTRAVLATARRTQVPRVVHTSTCSTCGPVRGRLADESDEPPKWELKVPYKRTKLAAERVALEAAATGQDVVIVNPGTPVGPRDRRPTPTGKMIADVAGGRARAYLGTTGLNIVDVRDLARGHVLAYEHGTAGERYLLGGDNLMLKELFAIIAGHAGRRRPRVRVPDRVVRVAARIAQVWGRIRGREPRLLVLDEVRVARWPMRFDDTRARTELGHASEPGRAALARAAATA